MASGKGEGLEQGATYDEATASERHGSAARTMNPHLDATLNGMILSEENQISSDLMLLTTTRRAPAKFFVFNTLSRKKELFRPKVKGKVSMYICGVTLYDYSHLGHARAYVAFDILYRFLEHLGYKVTYVRNFTDIDDKIINRANGKEDLLALTRRFAHAFHEDMASLRCLSPTLEPRVSEHIPEIIDMIQTIINNGCGYVAEGGDVYFSLDNYKDPGVAYGSLSGRKLDDNRAGERVAVDHRKRNPHDFALWKSSKPGEPSWESPWGAGRPGWHIECSAMSASTLGHSFDIHGGGMDLIFPHHENEYAQSRAACRESHVSYWMHNGFIKLNDEKMSKSLGNFFTIRQVLELYHPLALRWFLLSVHYRSDIQYTEEHLNHATDRVYYLYQTLAEAQGIVEQGQAQGKPSKPVEQSASALKKAFQASLADDLHVPINALAEPLRLLNELVSKKDKSRYASLKRLKEAVEEVLSILGLAANYEEVLQEMKQIALRQANVTEEYVQAKIQERIEARNAKDYARSDEIRAHLLSIGIALLDFGSQTVWRPATTALRGQASGQA